MMKKEKFMNSFVKYTDRETLERIKRWPSLKNRFPNVRIYSVEHMAYWRGKGNGYTNNESESDIWTCEEAFKRTNHCGPEKQIQFIGAK